MTTPEQDALTATRPLQCGLSHDEYTILAAIRKLDFGSITIKVQDGKPVHLATTTSEKLDASAI